MSSLSHWQSTLLLVLITSLSVVVRSAPAVVRVALEAEDDKSDVDKLGPKDAVTVKKEEDSPFALFEGDIMLSDLQKAALRDYNEPTERVTESVAVREKRSLIPVTQSPSGKAAIHHTWTNGVVPFERSTTLGIGFRKMLDMAIKIIENKTCIRFVERTNEANYLFFDNDNDCKSPTPTITTGSEDEEDISSTPMTDPSQTVATQAPRLKPRLKNGNILTLNLIDTKTINGKEETVYDDRGMECTLSPGCVPQECVGSTGCSGISNQFQIVKRDDSDTRNAIRGGNTVLLRSISNYSLWLDCSEPSQCTISECSEDNEEDTRNASYVSSCDKHRFKIFGVNRGNKILNVNTTLKFKHIDKDDYLKCDSRACGTNVSVCPLSSTTSCPTDIFKATKEAAE